MFYLRFGYGCLIIFRPWFNVPKTFVNFCVNLFHLYLFLLATRWGYKLVSATMFKFFVYAFYLGVQVRLATAYLTSINFLFPGLIFCGV